MMPRAGIICGLRSEMPNLRSPESESESGAVGMAGVTGAVGTAGVTAFARSAGVTGVAGLCAFTLNFLRTELRKATRPTFTMTCMAIHFAVDMQNRVNRTINTHLQQEQQNKA